MPYRADSNIWGSSRNMERPLLSNSSKIWSHVLAGLWVAHLTQIRAFFLALPALKILQTPSAKSVPLPKLQARCRLERSRQGGGTSLRCTARAPLPAYA